MKKNIVSFLSGAITMFLLICLPVTALAANGAVKIDVTPINVMVNGEVFQPKDANGNNAMVFTCNGTVYAPLRALAEAYGLTVGYDNSKNLVTINTPGKAAARDFTSCWTVTEKHVTNYGTEKVFEAKYNGI